MMSFIEWCPQPASAPHARRGGELRQNPGPQEGESRHMRYIIDLEQEQVGGRSALLTDSLSPSFSGLVIPFSNTDTSARLCFCAHLPVPV
uniref:Uncharacterized protein n=1 Tax=Timema douglasi TaxID=61478 RepID=A0A7R8W1J4_TIMDO|nr:unnamed protein product [Timema douglasi]